LVGKSKLCVLTHTFSALKHTPQPLKPTWVHATICGAWLLH